MTSPACTPAARAGLSLSGRIIVGRSLRRPISAPMPPPISPLSCCSSSLTPSGSKKTVCGSPAASTNPLFAPYISAWSSSLPSKLAFSCRYVSWTLERSRVPVSTRIPTSGAIAAKIMSERMPATKLTIAIINPTNTVPERFLPAECSLCMYLV